MPKSISHSKFLFRSSSLLISLFIGSALFFFSSSPHADEPPTRLRKDCKTDIQTYCPNLFKKRKELLTCLKNNEDNLTDSCKARIVESRVKFKDMRTVCAKDFYHYCHHQEGKPFDCLLQHVNDPGMSINCRTLLQNRISHSKR